MSKKKTWLIMLVFVLGLMLTPALSQKTVQAQSGSTTEAKVRNGWVTYGQHRYYYRNGRPVTGWITLDGKRFYFNRYGQSVTGWLHIDGHHYYLNQYGRCLTGFQKIGKYRYYFHKTYGFALTGWNSISGNRYYFDSQGRAIYGWLNQNGHRYYLNSYGRIYTGSQKIGNYRYFFHKKYGYALTGWNTINGYKYYYDSLGRAATGTRTINGIRYTFNGYGRVIRTSNPVVYRAVVIGEADYPGYSSDLWACGNDARAMRDMLKRTGYTTVQTVIDASEYRVRSQISSTFASADSNDVSLFYYTGHGSSDGSLITTDYGAISPSRLASWLKQVPGNVVVMLDSCYSGRVIDKALGAKAVDAKDGANMFNSSVVAAFNEAEAEVAKAGPMSNSKFKVLTACSQYELSWASQSRSFFSDALVSGVGFTYGGSRLSKAPADTNKDKKLTLKECYNYTRKRCGNRQHVQCYPSNSGFKLFQR